MKLAIIGAGAIGRRHLGNLHRLGVEELRVYDEDPAQLGRVSEQFPWAAVAPSLEAVLRGVDGAVIGTPPDSHVSIGRRSAEAGVALMIEKPLAHAPDGVEEWLSFCDRKGVPVLTAYNWRFWPPLQLAERLLKEGRIGRVLTARTEYGYHLLHHRLRGQDYRKSYMARAAQGGGCLLDESHAIDYMRWLLGEIAEVSAAVDRLTSWEIESDDVADLTVRFESGALGNIHMRLFTFFSDSHFQFIGEKGILEWKRSPNEVRVYDPDSQRWEIYPFTCQLDEMYVIEARHFLDCIRGSARPACDGWDGLKTLRVVVAARRAAAERRWVKV